MIVLENALVAVGGTVLLEAVDLAVNPGDRIGVIGPNGSGKSTLLRVLHGHHELEGGTRHVSGSPEIAYLPQGTVVSSPETVWNEVQRGQHRIHELAARVQEAHKAVEAGVAGAVERLGEAEDRFRAEGGYAAEEQVGRTLYGLGFPTGLWHEPTAHLSGGWQVRVALARALLSDCDLLLLDEPTNHLDLRARDFVAELIRKRARSVVVVSHDRHLLDVATNRTIELRGGRIWNFRGPFSAWWKERSQRDALVERQETARQAEIARLERFAERFKAKATKAAAAQSKLKAAERLRAESQDLPPPEERAVVRFAAAPPSAVPMLAFRGDVGWQEPVVRDVDLEVMPGMRVALLGINGCGKSTLLRTLAGGRPPLSGRVRRGVGVQIGSFDQDVADALPKDVDGLGWLRVLAPHLTLTRAFGLLGALGLGGDAARRPIGSMSGGERARTAIAGLCALPHNVLLLDEPTNHLDVLTVEALTEALLRFDGAILFATHDRTLVEQVATHVAEIAGGSWVLREGHEIPTPEEPQVATPSAAASTSEYEERKRRARERERARKRIDAIGRELEKKEARRAELAALAFEVAADYDRAHAVEAERKSVEAEVDALYEEWERLEGFFTGS